MNENESLPPPPPASTAPPLPPQAYALPAPPAAPSSSAPALKSPAAAGWLSVLPGLGHVYLGLYQRGAIFFLVWVAIMTFVSRHDEGPGALIIPFWWFFVLIDAVRQARSILATGAPEPNLFAGEKAIKADGNLTFGILLMLLGAFFLLDRLVTIDLSFLLDWWPVLLIAFGGWQVWLYATEKKRREDAARLAEADKLV